MSLFDLLPALYRLKDAQVAQSKSLTCGPLQSLLNLVEEQLAVVAEDLDQRYDDLFIETCASWVIPYLGDLIGYQSLYSGAAPAAASPRAEVGQTISFRRRKGTVLVVEQLARDVTSWGAHAVEFFKVLADTQYMNHLRPFNHYSPDLRRWQPGEYMDTAFDATAHTVDVRRIAVQRGRYDIQNVGVFLWSLNAYSLTMAPAAAVTNYPQCYRFSTLGRDIPLFTNPVSQGEEITALAQPVNVPDRLRPRVLCQDIRRQTNAAKSAPAVYYGIGKSLAVYVNNVLQGPANILVCDLSGADGKWANVPAAAGKVAVDPHLGRVALGSGFVSPAGATAPTVQASYYYGFNGDMAGGEYPRANTFADESVVVRVPNDKQLIQDALNALAGNGVVEITDSGVYKEQAGLNVVVNGNGRIELRAADGHRPTLVLSAPITATGTGPESVFSMNGLLVTYIPPPPPPPAAPATGAAATTPPVPAPTALVHVPATANQLSQLLLTHCTLDPLWAPAVAPQPAYVAPPALWVELPNLQVTIDKSILGSMSINGQAAVELTASIVDATSPTGTAYVASIDPTTQIPQPGGELTLKGCTVVGKVYATLLNLSNSIVWAWLSSADQAVVPPATTPIWPAGLWAARKQQGCVRFSYLPAGSVIPPQFECVELAPGNPQPLFVSLRYGDPGYAKLFPATDDAIRRGAHNGGEMGAFHFLSAPLRETNLRVRIQEFLPVGLEFGIFYET